MYINSIIALIATPIILNVIEKAKKGAFENTAYGIAKAAEYVYIENILDPNPQDQLFIYENYEESNVNGLELKYNGEEPESGVVHLKSDGRVSLWLWKDGYCAEKEIDENKVTVSTKTKEECEQEIEEPANTFIDSRDNEEYKFVKIGDQTWMAENLRYTGNDCLSNTWNNTTPYNACRANGAEIHYQWGAAMDGSITEGSQGICPAGWYIPTDEDWKILEGTVDSNYGVGDTEWDNSAAWRGSDAGTKLKSSTAGGTDDFGFGGLLVGSRNTSGALGNVGSNGHWWSSSRSGMYAWSRYVDVSNDDVFRDSFNQAGGASIRCIMDQ